MKKFLIIFCIIFLLIPTYIVISYIISSDNTPLNLRDLKTTEVTTPSGEVYSIPFAEEDDNARLFYSMLESKSSVLSLPSEASSKSPYIVSFISDHFITEYEYIFTESPSSCYIIVRDGVSVEYFRISDPLAELFLNSEYSDDVYPYSALPELKIGGKKVPYSRGEWTFQLYSGDMRKRVEENPTASALENVGSLSSDFNLEFSSEPDSIDIVLSDNTTGEIIYSGDHKGVSGITEKKNRDIRISINAEWSAGTISLGKVSYECLARLFAPAYFFISEPQCKEGSVIVLSAKNVVDPNSLSFSSEPAIDYKPVFIEDGDYYRALLPLPITDSVSDMNYRITLMCDDLSKEFDLIVTPRRDVSITEYNVSASLLRDIVVTGNPYQRIFADIKGNIYGKTDFRTNYTEGRFTECYPDGVFRYSFGTNVRYGTSTDNYYRTLDYHYVGNSSDMIHAMNTGKVVYIGELSYTGKLIIIDHGFGLLSWYWNLGKTADNLALGSIVKKGDILGFNGGEGLTETMSGKNISVHFAVTVFGTPVDMSSLLDNGLLVQNK